MHVCCDSSNRTWWSEYTLMFPFTVIHTFSHLSYRSHDWREVLLELRWFEVRYRINDVSKWNRMYNMLQYTWCQDKVWFFLLQLYWGSPHTVTINWKFSDKLLINKTHAWFIYSITTMIRTYLHSSHYIPYCWILFVFDRICLIFLRMHQRTNLILAKALNLTLTLTLILKA